MTRNAEIAAHIRKLLKHEKIPARVRISPAGGAVQVITKSYDHRWTAVQCRMIAHIADCNNLRGVRGDKLNVQNFANLTGKTQFDFHIFT